MVIRLLGGSRVSYHFLTSLAFRHTSYTCREEQYITITEIHSVMNYFPLACTRTQLQWELINYFE